MTSLFTYLQQALLFLNDQGIATFNTDDLTTYVNLGRQQIAAAGECVRAIGTLNLLSGIQTYPLTSITVSTAGASTGGVIAVRNVNVPATSGYGFIANRNFDWFTLYYIQTSGAQQFGTPNTWSVYGRGATAQLYFGPTPQTAQTCTLDCVALPNLLAQNADVEALPYPWTDAVPWYAAHYAAVSVQNVEAAKFFWEQFQEYLRRAGPLSTPSILPGNYVGGVNAQIAASKIPLSGAVAPQGG